jgi:hypothetical protein
MISNLIKDLKARHKAFFKFKTIPELLERFNVNLIPISLEHTKRLTISCTIEFQNFCNSKMPLFTIKI